MMARRSRRRWLPLLLALACVLVAVAAAARPGGGHSYSGGSRSSGSSHGSGSSHSGGGGGSGDGAGILFDLLVYLCIENPTIGIPLVLLVIGGIGVRAARPTGQKAVAETPPRVFQGGKTARPPSPP